MAKIEVEHRGLLTTEKFEELKKLFEQKAEFLGEKKRFSVISNASSESVRELKDELIDIKLRITNKKPELAVKYGKWSGKDARKEFNFHLQEDQFEDMLELLKILGYHKFCLMANTKYDYLYNGVEFSLVKVPEWGYYFEAEISAEEKDAVKADIKVEKELESLGLKALDEENYFKLLDELNKRDGCRIDLDNIDFKAIKNRFADYF